ncbi:hypothetical protein RUM44_000022 [Polyplax serrata]|uniref:Uncharacterized protein n=1 Tax=Polyplax serrata TaxID=468196 RepID=A0ABR1B494_POLSC
MAKEFSVGSSQWLSAPGGNTTSKSMDSLRSLPLLSSPSPPTGPPTRRPSFLVSSNADARRVSYAYSYDSCKTYTSFDELEKRNEKRKQDFLNLTIEKRRNIFAGNLTLGKSAESWEIEPTGRMHLSLQPSGSVLHVPDRRLTILSPHTSNCTPDLLQFGERTRESARNTLLLPKLMLPKSESQVFHSR